MHIKEKNCALNGHWQPAFNINENIYSERIGIHQSVVDIGEAVTQSRKMASSSTQRWMVDSGILRKKNNDEQPQELLVFGYSCKLFRDDDKAKMIDQGKHLIPWMGDNTLKIDRSVSVT